MKCNATSSVRTWFSKLLLSENATCQQCAAPDGTHAQFYRTIVCLLCTSCMCEFEHSVGCVMSAHNCRDAWLEPKAPRTSPVGILCLLLDEVVQVNRRWEDVGLCPWIAYEPAHNGQEHNHALASTHHLPLHHVQHGTIYCALHPFSIITSVRTEQCTTADIGTHVCQSLHLLNNLCCTQCSTPLHI